ncbi:fibulin-1-like isoform X2 [Acanthaster planci]|uniref:Fibulin-1-like isoform X2 n=1 Tax=Acanthaster planci TaxID=133434 RepID=A0A8B7XNY0_ACAPL|nr:fibulin-1-like isoform X2 [Acanthaster planci]
MWRGASVLLAVFATVSAVQLQHSISICCDDGAEYANSEQTCSGIDIKAIPSNLQLLEEEDIKDCYVVMRACCVKELQRDMCISGLSTRANIGSCDRILGDECASIEKTCCECCELGLKAFQESAPCEGTDLGTECDLAFRECCQMASSANDMDECTLARENNQRLCSAKCVNVIGSFVCECPVGYILAAADNMTCIRGDITNPCESSLCEQRCQPNGSSYVCSCEAGYELLEDGYSCHDASSPLLACMFANCDYGCRTIDASSYECYCDTGYDLDTDGTTCIDINECQEVAGVCPSGHTCTNIPGSYTCIRKCTTGLAYNVDSSRCEDIDECQEENVCPLHKQCRNYIGGFYCARTRCVEGEQIVYGEGNTIQCQDVDECARGTHDCPEGFRCDNSHGSFRCTRSSPCGTGYTVNAFTQQCTDIDECVQDTDDCPPEYYCQNTMGSYKCRPCQQGFKADSSDGCSLDIDECEELGDVCPPDQTCVNTYGSYRCNPGCPQGFQYSELYRECRDVNECALGLDDCRANQVCQNREGSFECRCRQGLEFNEVTRECDDINECESTPPRCRYHEQCFNYEGSFACQQRCHVNYRYSEEEGCVDINECEQEPYPCYGNLQCVNQPGSFRCRQCPRGQIANREARQCEDVDECKYRGANCMGGCRNTIGSYMCTCPQGYNLVGRFSCRDINECRVNTHNCSSQSDCFNTRGGFKCRSIQCPQHYRKEVEGEEVRCVKVSLCPNNDFSCINDLVKLITYNKIALPSVNGDLTEPVLLLRLQIRDLTYTQVQGLRFLLTQGNELGLFSVTKDVSREGYDRWNAVGTLYLEEAIVGPYETDLRLEMQLFNVQVQREELLSITVAVFSIDVSPNAY